MVAGVAGTVTGWMAVGLTAVNVSLPYLLRGRWLAPQGWSVSYLERMRPHYWIGITVAGLVFVHSGLAMSGPIRAGGFSFAGLWIGTGGLFLVAAQAMVGMRLRTLRGAERLRLRRTHFRIMLGLVATAAVHVALNGPVSL